ncbi:Hypothetical_protein [Hexamita inflata]|uniref:Hypothetical_protein n=1 Tax=Hexamita inflata TaxID=28002 RepID=A0ABP1H7T2_9EUKA
MMQLKATNIQQRAKGNMLRNSETRSSIQSFSSVRSSSLRASFVLAKAPPISSAARQNVDLSEVDLFELDLTEIKRFSVFSLQAELQDLKERLNNLQNICATHCYQVQSMSQHSREQMIRETNRVLYATALQSDKTFNMWKGLRE